MKVLLDTHVWLWLQTRPERLNAAAMALLSHDDTVRIVSAVTVWEIAIKYGLGKLPLPSPPETAIPAFVEASGSTPLAVTYQHSIRAGALPYHHRDPFDRLLIAQAQVEGIPLMTVDRQFQAYDVQLIAA